MVAALNVSVARSLSQGVPLQEQRRFIWRRDR